MVREGRIRASGRGNAVSGDFKRSDVLEQEKRRHEELSCSWTRMDTWKKYDLKVSANYPCDVLGARS